MNISLPLCTDSNLKPIVATEIEFYLHDASARFSPAQIIERISESCARADIALASAEQERGPDQYEVALLPSSDIDRTALDTERFKTLMNEAFGQADFAAKPWAGQPGSGLHVHVHLEDAAGKNIFFRKGEDFSPLLLNAIGGLLECMNPCMTVFAPTEESYKRFAANSNAPTTVSWGTNNRTVAVRLPAKPMDHKHIEHRVAGSDADVAKVIEAILAGIHYGLMHKCDPGKPVYGDASLAQYGLPLLARSLEEAKGYASQFPGSPPLKGED